MRRTVVVLGIGLLVGIVVLVSSCSVQANRRTRELGHISVGDSEASVLTRLGQPRVREYPGQPYLVYATNGCAAPCATRLWWEWPLFRGMEAWSVDLDASRKVIRATHWVSA